MSRLLSPAGRLLFSLAFALSVLRVESFPGLGLLAGVAVLIAWEGGVPPGRAVRLIRPLMPLACLAFLYGLAIGLIQPAAGAAPGGPSPHALFQALFPALRLLLLGAGAGLATLTLPPTVLLKTMARLAEPFHRGGLPARDLIWTAFLAYRFVPLLTEESQRVALARQARGAALPHRRWRDPSRSLLALVIPVAVRALRRADQLVWALEARGFHPRSPLPRAEPLWTRGEYLPLGLGLIVLLWTAWRY